jgi:hypothetical protein
MTGEIHYVLVQEDGEVIEIFDELEHAKSVGSRRAVLSQTTKEETAYFQAVPPSWYQMSDDEWHLDTDDGVSYVIYER